MTNLTNRKINVLIVDDHNLFNDGLAAMLASTPEITVIGQVYESKDTLREVQLHRPDLLLMDFNMPKINGLEMTRLLLKSYPDLKILVLSMYNEPRFIEDFKSAGAKGYALKTTVLNELVGIIRRIHEGSTCFEQTRSASMASNHSKDDFLQKHKLTPREIEILKLVKGGMTNQQIAEKIFLSVLTVQTHRRNIHFKLEIKGEADLIRWLEKNEF
nr:response regulator transcription factor [uncultured Dyadobacter sp.]